MKAGNENYLEVGQAGEDVILRWLRRKHRHVHDVRNDIVWRRRDVDFIAGGFFYEVKTDERAALTGNLCFELTRHHGGPGCFFRSKADYWVYNIVGQRRALVFRLSDAQAWLCMNMASVQITPMRAHYGRTWKTFIGALVPIDLFTAGVAVDIIQTDL